MMNGTLTQQIDAEPAEVFRRSTDVPSWPNSIRGIKRVELLTPGPIGLGTRFKETRIMFGREATETMEFIEFDPPRKYVLGCNSCGCIYRSEFLFEPKSGGTLLTFTFASQPVSFMAKVMGFILKPLMAKMMKKCLEEVAKDINDLKENVEARATA